MVSQMLAAPALENSRGVTPVRTRTTREVHEYPIFPAVQATHTHLGRDRNAAIASMGAPILQGVHVAMSCIYGQCLVICVDVVEPGARVEARFLEILRPGGAVDESRSAPSIAVQSRPQGGCDIVHIGVLA